MTDHPEGEVRVWMGGWKVCRVLILSEHQDSGAADQNQPDPIVVVSRCFSEVRVWTGVHVNLKDHVIAVLAKQPGPPSPVGHTALIHAA